MPACRSDSSGVRFPKAFDLAWQLAVCRPRSLSHETATAMGSDTGLNSGRGKCSRSGLCCSQPIGKPPTVPAIDPASRVSPIVFHYGCRSDEQAAGLPPRVPIERAGTADMEGARDRTLPELSNRPRIGRSGPRRKTGCLTCRKRKVRCDEGKPTCNRCRRLQVLCIYQKSQGSAASSAADADHGTDLALASSSSPKALALLRQFERDPSVGAGNGRPGNSVTGALDEDHLHAPSPAAADQHCPSRTGPEAAEKRQERFKGNASWPPHGPAVELQAAEPSVLFAEFTDDLDDFFLQEVPPPPNVLENRDQVLSAPPESPPPGNFGLATPAYGVRLQQYFMSLVSPPRLILSVECDWRDVRDSVLTMAETSPPLRNAIYAFSDAHLCVREGREPVYAANYYDQASTELGKMLNGDVGGKELKACFAAIFFLIYVEVCSPSPWRSVAALHAGRPSPTLSFVLAPRTASILLPTSPLSSPLDPRRHSQAYTTSILVARCEPEDRHLAGSSRFKGNDCRSRGRAARRWRLGRHGRFPRLRG